MAWDTTLVNRLRYYINDLDATAYDWTDTQLKTFLVIAASYVNSELNNWIGGYTIDTDALTIVPDPVSTSGSTAFSNLMVLRAACIITRAEVKQMLSSAGFRIVDDKSTIDSTSAVDAAKEKAGLFCDDYEKAVKEFQKGNMAEGQAILGPYSSSDWINYLPPEWQHNVRRE